MSRNSLLPTSPISSFLPELLKSRNPICLSGEASDLSIVSRGNEFEFDVPFLILTIPILRALYGVLMKKARMYAIVELLTTLN
jgi:hypothetical protein